MTNKITFSMIKPDAVTDAHTGSILKMIEGAGFRIKGLKMTKLTKAQAGDFYIVHKDRPFYNDLIEVMTKGHIIVMVLEKENAVIDFRKLIGATNPANADEGTIRKLYARSLESNAIHGSDSDENAGIESNFFFTKEELF